MSESRWLILETSGPVGQVALAVGNTVCAQRTLNTARRHARDLAPAVGELLSQQGWKPHDLTGVIVSQGPGSYTGLRVGIMSAKALAFATGCALIGVETFSVVASQAPAHVQQVDVIGDAQQDKIYVQRFQRIGDETLLVTAPLAIRRMADWLAGRDASIWVSGPGLHRFCEGLPAECRIIERDLWDPSTEALFRLGLARYDRGERDDVFGLEPLYLRPSAAEEQWKRV